MINAQELRLWLHYDPDTGIFAWRKNKARAKAGNRAGHLSDGRWVITINQVCYLAHRLAWFYMTGEWPPIDVDHRDVDPLNNRWSNLRLATKTQNNANARRRPHNKSGWKGIYASRRPDYWNAMIRVKSKGYWLGTFDCPAAAHFAYSVEADKRFGEFARAA